MKTLPELFAKNRAWAAHMRAVQPTFFEELSRQQSPHYLWIGCSDSRVPANEIVGLLPGELFVHRNVANLVIHTDMNCLSVLQYAIDQLRIKHVIVCGHYGCGGVRAALQRQPHGLIDNWLRHIRDIAQRHRQELDALADDEARLKRLCELNIVNQVVNVGNTTIVQDAWVRGQSVQIHGWVYDLADGLLNDLGVSIGSPADLETLSGR